MRLILHILFLSLLSGCYSLSGIAISPETESYYVAPFENRALNAVPTLAQQFTEQLKDKITRQSRLLYDDTNPDVSFSGVITNYDVTPEAPQAGETTAVNRLTITVSVEFENANDEKANWKKSFSFSEVFAGDENLLDVQDDLIAVINRQLTEDIFNAAFNKW